jgi:hypothetical protein
MFPTGVAEMSMAGNGPPQGGNGAGDHEALRAIESLSLDYKGIEGAVQELWRAWLRVGRGTRDCSAACSGVCRTPSRGLEDPKLPLSTPTGVQLVRTSSKRVEGDFSEVRELRILVSTRAEFSRTPPCWSLDPALVVALTDYDCAFNDDRTP